MYPCEFPYKERLSLPTELRVYYQIVRNDTDFANLDSIAKLAKKMMDKKKHTSHPLVYRWLKLALVLPIATATVERCFSKMKLIITDLRNWMGGDYFNGALTCAIEKEELTNVKNEGVRVGSSYLDSTIQGPGERRTAPGESSGPSPPNYASTSWRHPWDLEQTMLRKVRKRHCKSGTKWNAIFALPGHGSKSFVGRKSNVIFALPDHGSTSSVGRKSNVIFALPDRGSTPSVGRKSNAIFALPGRGSTSSVGRKSSAIFALPGHRSTSSVGRKSSAIFALPGHRSTSSVDRKSNAIFALPGRESTSSIDRKSNAIFGRKLKIDMAAYGWKVRTSSRRTRHKDSQFCEIYNSVRDRHQSRSCDNTVYQEADSEDVEAQEVPAPIGQDRAKKKGSSSGARSETSIAGDPSLVDALLSKFTMAATPIFTQRKESSSEYLRIKERELELKEPKR
ncbi:RNA-directed DNA polymerase, eukaryota, reverse transcriptase zinc-binding domain protein [Tanacetum coccineum]